MTKYREILRLKSLGISEREIATSCSVSRNTVARVCKRAAELNIQWPLDPSVTDKDLKEQLFPREEAVVSGKRLPVQIPLKQHADSDRTACCSASRGTE